MGQVETLTFLTKADKIRFEMWTKEQVYEAYLSEVVARKTLEQHNKLLNRQLAEARYILR